MIRNKTLNTPFPNGDYQIWWPVYIERVILNYCPILYALTLINGIHTQRERNGGWPRKWGRKREKERQQSSLTEIYCVIFITWKANRVERRFHVFALAYSQRRNSDVCNRVRYDVSWSGLMVHHHSHVAHKTGEPMTSKTTTNRRKSIILFASKMFKTQAMLLVFIYPYGLIVCVRFQLCCCVVSCCFFS